MAAFNPSIFGSLSLSSIRKCTVRPNGTSSSPSSSGPAVPGPRSGWWTTHTIVRVQSQRIGVPELNYESITTTRSDTIGMLQSFVAGIVIPKASEVAKDALLNTDVFPRLDVTHVDEAGIDWENGVFIGSLTVPSYLPGVPDLSITFSDQIPNEIRQAIESLVTAFVIPAAAEEMGLGVI